MARESDFCINGSLTFGRTPRPISAFYSFVALFLFCVAFSNVEASQGGLDGTFGKGGKTRIVGLVEKLAGASPTHSAIQSDGKILLVSSAGSYPDHDFVVVRLHRNGSLDKSFGSGGKITTDFGGQEDSPIAVAVQADGKVVVAGSTRISTRIFDTDFAIARYNSDGSLDGSFGDHGKVTTDVENVSFPTDMALQRDGKIVLAGIGQGSMGSVFALVRYNSDGRLDNSFGVSGKTLSDKAIGDARAIAIQANGKIVVSGYTSIPYTNNPGTEHLVLALARFGKDGKLDSGFGTGGEVITDFGGNLVPYEVAVRPNGQIVVVGSNEAPETLSTDLLVVCYHHDGRLNRHFGNDGKVTTNFDAGYQEASVIAFQPNGRIVVAGTGNTDGIHPFFALARYYRDGKLDERFGVNGKLTSTFSTRYTLFGTASGALTPDGKLVVAVEGLLNGNDYNRHMLLSRYFLYSEKH